MIARAHKHNKACEMRPTRKPAMARNKTDYCQLKGRLHSTRPLHGHHTGVGGEGGRPSEQAWGGAGGSYTGVWLTTSFSSCPDQKETLSHPRWQRTRMRLAGWPGHPRHGRYSHAALQRGILHGQGEFVSRNCQTVCPVRGEAILYASLKSSVYLRACSRRTFLCWQP